MGKNCSTIKCRSYSYVYYIYNKPMRMINSESLLAYGKYTHIAIQMKNKPIKYDFLFQATRMTLSFILLYKCSRMWNVEMGDVTEGQSAIGDREKREKKNHCHRRYGSLRSKCDGRCLMMTPFFPHELLLLFVVSLVCFIV